MEQLTAYRKRKGLTLAQTAAVLGLGSKGHLSRLERGKENWPIRLALETHRWSEGAVPAESLVSEYDAKLLRDYVRLQPQAEASAA